MARTSHTWSALLYALAWPVPVFLVVGCALVVVNERVLHAHVFPAAQVGLVVALAAMLVAAWRAS